MPLPPLDRPLVFFDLETTGLMIDIDRIIEISALKLHPGGRRETLTQRFDPGIKIPAESSAVHGLYNHDLVGQPRFADMAQKVFDLFADADLGGFAIKRFDIPMLTKEFERAGLKFSMEGRRVVDVSVIYRDFERRNLGSAYRFYTGKELVGAHGAEADNNATYEVFLAQLEKYERLPKDMEGLHEFCNAIEPSWVDRDGKLVWRDGEAFFAFGKYRYKSLSEVCRTDPGYMDWVVQKGEFPKDFTEICAKARKGEFPRNPAAAKAAPK